LINNGLLLRYVALTIEYRIRQYIHDIQYINIYDEIAHLLNDNYEYNIFPLNNNQNNILIDKIRIMYRFMEE
jgi:hypothetical protein